MFVNPQSAMTAIQNYPIGIPTIRSNLSVQRQKWNQHKPMQPLGAKISPCCGVYTITI